MHVVTGATGHVGNVLVRELLKDKKKVRAIIEPNTSNLNLYGLDIEMEYANILDRQQLVKAFEGAEVVYHLAAKISILPGQDKIIHAVNYEGTKNVIEACRSCHVKRLVYMSSVHALTEPASGIIDESMPFDPHNDRGEYDRSKAKASIEVIKAAEEGLETVIVCPSGVIGPYDYLMSSLAKTFLNFINKKINFVIEGAYDFVDVRDVVAGTILAAEKGKSGHTYILSGERSSIRDIFLKLGTISGRELPKRSIPRFLALGASCFSTLYCLITKATPYFTTYALLTLMRNSSFSHQKATSELGYRPRPITHSLRDTFRWFKKTGMVKV